MQDKIKTLNNLCYSLYSGQPDWELQKEIHTIIEELKTIGFAFIKKIDPEYPPQLQKLFADKKHFHQEKIKAIESQNYEDAAEMRNSELVTLQKLIIEIKKIQSGNLEIFRLKDESGKTIELVTIFFEEFDNL